MKKAFSIICIFVFLIFLTSCGEVRNDTRTSEVDVDQIKLSVFTDIWRASPLPNGLQLGESWKTDSFTMSFEENNGEITISFEPQHYTISECFEDGNIFMNAVSFAEGQDKFLFASELFYMMALMEDVDTDSASATIHSPSNAEAIMLILIMDGTVYNEILFLN